MMSSSKGLFGTEQEDITEVRDVITAAATAEVDCARPPIYGTVTLHCLDQGEPLRLSMPMLDALLLLNSLREIESTLGLESWSRRLGCSLNAIDELSAELRLHDATEQGIPTASTLIN
jgi:hypothetical protein